MTRRVTNSDIWFAGLRTGLAVLGKEPVLGLKRLLLPSSYWRTPEFAYAWNQLGVDRGASVLDLGSPKDLAGFLARDHGLAVTAVDILDDAIAISRRFAQAQGIDGNGPGRVRSELADGRRLTYADGAFDAAYSVSVVEHIPEGGDSDAIRELARVVRPGGRIVVTTPFAREKRDTFVAGPVYEREQRGSEPVFYQRHYDRQSLDERLIKPSGCKLIDLQLWGEHPSRRGESFLDSLGPVRTLLSPLEAVIATACLRPTDGTDGVEPMAVFFTLEKQPNPI